jgi:glycerol-3-phosphate acyltransferase PlsY
MSAGLWVVIAFVAGTFPSPYLIARALRRRDVIAAMRRGESQGDAHFLVIKGIGRGPGIASIVLDMTKGFLPALLAVRAHVDHETLAWVGLAAVIGHSFAPFLRHAGGRGLTTAAGVSLAIVPLAMTVSGAIALAGTFTKRGGIGTSIGYGLLPVFALALEYPAALVWMSLGIAVLIGARRLEGLSEDRASGVSIPRALFGRLLFDLPGGKGSIG